jgi:predicted amidohydrolase
MDHMVRQMKRDTSATLPELVRMASLTPAELTGIAKQTGSLEAGKKADVVLSAASKCRCNLSLHENSDLTGSHSFVGPLLNLCSCGHCGRHQRLAASSLSISSRCLVRMTEVSSCTWLVPIQVS